MLDVYKRGDIDSFNGSQIGCVGTEQRIAVVYFKLDGVTDGVNHTVTGYYSEMARATTFINV